MRSINLPLRPQLHQHQPQRTAQMMLVRTPQGMGWVHPSALGQQAPQQPTAGGAFKNLLILGALGFAGYWAWNKWGSEMLGGGASEPARESKGYVRSRKRRRSRSRLMSEFKQFLDNDGANEMEELEECAPYGATSDDEVEPEPETAPDTDDEDEDEDEEDSEGEDEEEDKE